MLIFICSAIISLSMSKRPKNSPATKRGPGPRYPWASPGLYVQFLKVCKDLKEDLKSPTAAVFQKIAEGIKSAGFPEPTNDQVRSKMRQQKVISDLEKFAAVEILRTSCICLCWHGAEALIEDETADRLPEGDDDEVVLHPTGWSLEVPPRLYHVLRHGGYKIEAEHSAGEEFITLHWRLQTPTLSEMKERYQSEFPDRNWHLYRFPPNLQPRIDFTNPRVIEGINSWQDDVWDTIIKAPVPAIPSLYLCGSYTTTELF